MIGIKKMKIQIIKKGIKEIREVIFSGNADIGNLRPIFGGMGLNPNHHQLALILGGCAVTKRDLLDVITGLREAKGWPPPTPEEEERILSYEDDV